MRDGQDLAVAPAAPQRTVGAAAKLRDLSLSARIHQRATAHHFQQQATRDAVRSRRPIGWAATSRSRTTGCTGSTTAASRASSRCPIQGRPADPQARAARARRCGPVQSPGAGPAGSPTGRRRSRRVLPRTPAPPPVTDTSGWAVAPRGLERPGASGRQGCRHKKKSPASPTATDPPAGPARPAAGVRSTSWGLLEISSIGGLAPPNQPQRYNASHDVPPRSPAPSSSQASTTCTPTASMGCFLEGESACPSDWEAFQRLRRATRQELFVVMDNPPTTTTTCTFSPCSSGSGSSRRALYPGLRAKPIEAHLVRSSVYLGQQRRPSHVVRRRRVYRQLALPTSQTRQHSGRSITGIRSLSVNKLESH